MLKKRSSAVCGKQGLMSDSEASSVMSPTSILETKPFSAAQRKAFPWDVMNSKKVGLGIVDALNNEKNDKKSSKAESRMVLFGSQLKVHIPSSTCQNSVVSPHSLIEFGVKNKNSKLAMSLLSPQRRILASPSALDLCLSPSEMELSEDYTRVVSHGPNPRTVHIFDTCNLERCSNGLSPLMKVSMDGSSSFASDDFLAFCQSCRKKLGLGKDIFMYRGEKAFCSNECRDLEIVLDKETENSGRREPPAASP